MLIRLTILSSISIVALAACATPQENPYYKYSSKYNGGTTTTVTQAGSVIQTAPVVYETASYEAAQAPSYTRASHDCLRKEKNHELIGAGIGGTIGALAGKELIGGTKGTVIGAGLGGTVGYGFGDKTVDCDLQPVPVQHMSTTTSPSYTQEPSYTAAQSHSAAYDYTTSQQSYTAEPTVTASYSEPVIAEPNVSPTDTEFTSITETGTPGYQVMQSQTVDMYEAVVTTPAETPAMQTISGAREISYDYAANTVAVSADTVAMPSETRLLAGSYYGSHTVKEGDTVYSLSRKHCVGINDIQSLNNLDAGYSINIGDTLQLPASNC